ncbi:immunoglobulin superfamily DCC subclass member 3, partial [Paramuricea clavata]
QKADTVKIESINQTTKIKSILTISSVCSDGCFIGRLGSTDRRYTCEARNKNGTSGKTRFTVKISGMPKAPVIHSSEVISSSSILVKWKAVTMVAKPVILYTLYYNADQEKSPRAVNITVKNSTGNYEHRLLKLNQLTAYSISLSATNIFGEGTVSEPVVEKTSPIDPQPPEILNDGTVTHQNISLTFVKSLLNKRGVIL